MLRAASLAALSLLAALVVACGSGSAGGEADPASAVPADAMFYGEVNVRPEGDLRQDTLDAAGKVLRTDDPEGTIRELIDKAFAEEDQADLDYDKDVKPWLGERLGLWFGTRLDGEGDPVGALIVAVTDTEAAMEAVRKSRKNNGDKLASRSYNGTEFDVDQDGVAMGIVGDDYLAVGDEAEFKKTVDAAKGQSLAESDRYRKALDSLEDQRLAHFYVDFKRLLSLAARSGGGQDEQDLQQLQALIPFDKLGALMGSFQASADRLAIDVSLKAQPSGGALGALGNLYSFGSTPLLRDLPGDSWVAFGSPKYGASLKAALDQYAGMFGGAAVQQQLERQFGIDLDEDLLSWMGDVGGFVRGDTLPTLDGGLVIQVTDEGRAAKGFGKLVGLLQSAGDVSAKPVSLDGAETAFELRDTSIPKPIILARSREKVVATYGLEAAKAALNPQSKLGDSEVFEQAQDALDDDMEPSMLVAMPPILSLVESSGGGGRRLRRGQAVPRGIRRDRLRVQVGRRRRAGPLRGWIEVATGSQRAPTGRSRSPPSSRTR
jgi:hypothetical protein